ncbi:hypothetical protein [Bradyrhizobium sp. 195]|uniref:hypothetical protein n=1 Tax=Bradyrhizobium sp. 195 TaxID=2782662 RepID=UPI002000E893|nr:hypothetical protein [Bradyrhizobium sp. 195]UPK31339.1 hypothetical protein IVB26_39895 [Bradyrhizobium sp. 195]
MDRDRLELEVVGLEEDFGACDGEFAKSAVSKAAIGRCNASARIPRGARIQMSRTIKVLVTSPCHHLHMGVAIWGSAF